MPRPRTGLVTATLAALLLSCSLLPSGADAQSAARPQGVAVPSYFYPGPLWTQMEQATPTLTRAIINPNSGPGADRNPEYAAQVRRSQGVGIAVLGYVWTDYGRRPARLVRADIDRYRSWYGVNGIFLDEASTDCARQPYYAELNAHVKRKGMTITALNPGTRTNECYASAADVLVTFEGTYSTYASGYAAAGWEGKYAPDKFWHLVYEAPDSAAMQDAVARSKQRGAGWVYVTPDMGANPWDTLPEDTTSDPYWTGEISAAASSDGTAASAPTAASAGAEARRGPRRGAPSFDPKPYIGRGDRYDCADFISQATAQAVLRTAPDDPNRLDEDRNGVACEQSPAPYDQRPVVRR